MRQALKALAQLQTKFNPDASRQKERILKQAVSLKSRSAQAIFSYHELLLFISAYPDNSEVRALAALELKRVKSYLLNIPSESDLLVDLENSGIAGTVSDLSTDIDSVRWLTEEFPGALDIGWEDDFNGASLAPLLQACVSRIERDSVLLNEISTRDWLAIARGDEQLTDLAWLLQRMSTLQGESFLVEKVFDMLELPVRWHLKHRGASRTFQRFPARKIFYHSELLKASSSWVEQVRKPMLPPARRSAREKKAILSVVRSALCVRDRETLPVTFANTKELELFCLDRGVDVFVVGAIPEYRQPIESYFGFMAAKNRLPTGYGGCWILGERAEIGLNVFDSFRGGESLFLFSQIMRIFYGHFGVRYFLVLPYQFGEDNPEAIKSGAYWFYYRLGFRSTDPILANIAQRERKKILSDRKYRTSQRILRKLTGSPLALDLRKAQSKAFVPLDVTRIGLTITEFIGRKFQGDREKAIKQSFQKIQRVLPVENFSNWNSSEQYWFQQFCLIAILIDDLQNWSAREKDALSALMRAKGGVKERAFAKKVQRHARFLSALARLHDRGEELTQRYEQ